MPSYSRDMLVYTLRKMKIYLGSRYYGYQKCLNKNHHLMNNPGWCLDLQLQMLIRCLVKQ